MINLNKIWNQYILYSSINIILDTTRDKENKRTKRIFNLSFIASRRSARSTDCWQNVVKESRTPIGIKLIKKRPRSRSRKGWNGAEARRRTKGIEIIELVANKPDTSNMHAPVCLHLFVLGWLLRHVASIQFSRIVAQLVSC